METTKFDKTDEYETEIINLVFKLRAACNRNKIPMFLSLAVKNDKNGTVYKNEMVSADSLGYKLQDDHLVRFVDILNGFDAVPKRENMEVFHADDLY